MPAFLSPKSIGGVLYVEDHDDGPYVDLHFFAEAVEVLGENLPDAGKDFALTLLNRCSAEEVRPDAFMRQASFAMTQLHAQQPLDPKCAVTCYLCLAKCLQFSGRDSMPYSDLTVENCYQLAQELLQENCSDPDIVTLTSETHLEAGFFYCRWAASESNKKEEHISKSRTHFGEVQSLCRSQATAGKATKDRTRLAEYGLALCDAATSGNHDAVANFAGRTMCASIDELLRLNTTLLHLLEKHPDDVQHAAPTQTNTMHSNSIRHYLSRFDLDDDVSDTEEGRFDEPRLPRRFLAIPSGEARRAIEALQSSIQGRLRRGFDVLAIRELFPDRAAFTASPGNAESKTPDEHQEFQECRLFWHEELIRLRAVNLINDSSESPSKAEERTKSMKPAWKVNPANTRVDSWTWLSSSKALDLFQYVCPFGSLARRNTFPHSELVPEDLFATFVCRTGVRELREHVQVLYSVVPRNVFRKHGTRYANAEEIMRVLLESLRTTNPQDEEMIGGSGGYVEFSAATANIFCLLMLYGYRDIAVSRFILNDWWCDDTTRAAARSRVVQLHQLLPHAEENSYLVEMAINLLDPRGFRVVPRVDCGLSILHWLILYDDLDTFKLCYEALSSCELLWTVHTPPGTSTHIFHESMYTSAFQADILQYAASVNAVKILGYLCTMLRSDKAANAVLDNTKSRKQALNVLSDNVRRRAEAKCTLTTTAQVTQNTALHFGAGMLIAAVAAWGVGNYCTTLPLFASDVQKQAEDAQILPRAAEYSPWLSLLAFLAFALVWVRLRLFSKRFIPIEVTPSALMFACTRGHWQAAELLLDAGANPCRKGLTFCFPNFEPLMVEQPLDAHDVTMVRCMVAATHVHALHKRATIVKAAPQGDIEYEYASSRLENLKKLLQRMENTPQVRRKLDSHAWACLLRKALVTAVVLTLCVLLPKDFIFSMFSMTESSITAASLRAMFAGKKQRFSSMKQALEKIIHRIQNFPLPVQLRVNATSAFSVACLPVTLLNNESWSNPSYMATFLVNALAPSNGNCTLLADAVATFSVVDTSATPHMLVANNEVRYSKEQFNYVAETRVEVFRAASATETASLSVLLFVCVTALAVGRIAVYCHRYWSFRNRRGRASQSCSSLLQCIHGWRDPFNAKSVRSGISAVIVQFGKFLVWFLFRLLLIGLLYYTAGNALHATTSDFQGADHVSSLRVQLVLSFALAVLELGISLWYVPFFGPSTNAVVHSVCNRKICLLSIFGLLLIVVHEVSTTGLCSIQLVLTLPPSPRPSLPPGERGPVPPRAARDKA